MELLEFEKEEENNAPIDIDDDDKYDNSDLFCEEDDNEDFHLSSGCGENPFAHFFQSCEQMICTNCVKRNNCPLGGLYKLTLRKANRGH